MSWSEVKIAKNENRHELILSGPTISERIEKEGLDLSLFDLTSLNYLNIHDTVLSSIDDKICNLNNLQTLVLHSNKLINIPADIAKLDKLKVLDISRNALVEIPNEIAGLSNLTTLNVASNCLKVFPKSSSFTKLQVLDLSNNQLEVFPDICHAENANLTDLKLNSNLIEDIPTDISKLIALKNFDISKNKIKAIPGEILDCNRIKEINLKDNPIEDRRLLKLIDQCRTKQVLDYVRQHCKKSGGDGKKGKKGKKENDVDEVLNENALKLKVLHLTDETIRIVIDEKVKNVRGHILACLLHNVEFTEETFKKFIQLQTKMHETLCEKRNAATIATHDASKIASNTLTYTALLPKALKIKPLNRNVMSGEQLFNNLKVEAENLRREKKRNVYSGIHKYLYLLEGQKFYPCLLREDKEVISFPPITNSDITKISVDTQSIFIEVTSSTSQAICKKVLDELIKETIALLSRDLIVEQVKSTDSEGNFKSVYPSKVDLVFENTNIAVIRE